MKGLMVINMARKARKKSSIGAYHIILRGQKKLFVNKNDMQDFFELLKKYFTTDGTHLFGYSIEDKKIHLVFQSENELGFVVKPFCTSYARLYNRVNNKSGKLFYDRFMSEPLENTDEICDAVVFVHSKTTAITSYDEYKNEKKLCSVELLSNEEGYENIIGGNSVKLLLDDYSSMSDKELKNYILSTYQKTGTKLSTEDKIKLAADAVSHCNLSKSRVCNILDINVGGISHVKKRTKQPPKPENNRELSVWLL